MTKNITINAPEDLSIDRPIQIEQTISQPADLEVGPIKVGDSSVLTVSNIAFVLVLMAALALLNSKLRK